MSVEHTPTPECIHIKAKCLEVIGENSASNASLQVANYLLSMLDRPEDIAARAIGTEWLPLDYFVGNANGRGLIRIESHRDSEEAGLHIASMQRGKASEEKAAFIVRAVNSHDALVKALQKCAAVCAGESMGKNSLIEALEMARTALASVEK